MRNVTSLAIRSLHVYPLKSCKGISVREAVLERQGLRDDRRWMVVDQAGDFVTQRTEPRLALVHATVVRESDGAGGLVLDAPGLEPLRIPAASSTGSARSAVRVWGYEVEAEDCGSEAATWMTRWLGSPVRIVATPKDFHRPVGSAYATPGDCVGFADGFPLLIVNTASLADLNSRLEHPLPMNRFRPNIVVDGADPWDEDRWKHIRIGGVGIRVVDPCVRCAVTTTDQDTATTGAEPLRTLATFRREGKGVIFGQNGIPDGEGILRVGMS